MLEAFKTYLSQHRIFDVDECILVAASGGLDSSVLAYLLKEVGQAFAIAHCNFGLRGEESDGDQVFVEQLAANYKVTCYTKRLDVAAYIQTHGGSVQMAARALRYEWFNVLVKEEGYTKVAVAHHRDDEVETFLLNMIRGTGITGLKGMALERGNIVRPLLFASRQQLEAYAKKQCIAFREDSSNTSTRYLRNKIRHELVPLLQTMNPSVQDTIANEAGYLNDVFSIYQQALQRAKKMAVECTDKTVKIDLNALETLHPLRAYLHGILAPYGFKGGVIDEIETALTGLSGKQFFSTHWRLIKDRNYLVLTPNEVLPSTVFQINEDLKTKTLPVGIQLQRTQAPSNFSSNPKVAYVDWKKLTFPLVLRRWQEGDAFYPLGMKGKKKLSDFFIDQKFSLLEKEQTWLLTSNDAIVWVVGHRIDERFKVTERTEYTLYGVCDLDL